MDQRMKAIQLLESKAVAGKMTLSAHVWPYPHFPDLPIDLEVLDACYLELETLPPLPSTLIVLNLRGNRKLKSLPPLPLSLTELIINGTGITEIPPLPPNLVTLDCHGTKITVLPDLPPRLATLVCSYTNLTSLPPLPASLRNLDCTMSPLTSLPILPTDLTDLKCGSCRLRTLPRIPLKTTVLCKPNPWSPEFGTIFQPVTDIIDYWSFWPRQRRAVNMYNNFQEIKAKARDVVNVQTTIARALSDDVANIIGSFFSGSNATLANQIGCMQALIPSL